MLKDKMVVLGVTGSIAAYKAAEIASQLTQSGAVVNVVMTQGATEFISPLTFRALTGRPVVTEMFDVTSEFSVEHVSLARSADIVAIAPATANVIAKLAAGIADDMLCCTVLATRAPVIVAPAMETNMYESPITRDNLSELKERNFVIVGPPAMETNMYENPISRDNLSELKERNFVIVGPTAGWLASGREGLGRLADIGDIIGTIRRILGKNGDLAGRHVVVTAGGTQEPIDPVRCIVNRSSGKMGYALAEAALDRGARVSLVTAPVSLRAPVGAEVINISTAQEMRQATESVAPEADVLIMAAAVADFRPKSVARDKLKRRGSSFKLELESTPDIIGGLRGDVVKVGFAAETANMVENATEKLRQKGLDLIVANDVTASDSGFGADTNRVTIIDKDGGVDALPVLSKHQVADRVLDNVARILGKLES